MTSIAAPRPSRLPFYVLAGVLATYLVLVVLHGRLLNIDEIFYKAAGAHWALDGHFAAPELIGRLPFDPPIEKIFACYPPLYPFSFGVFSRVFGFGHIQVCLFDALLRVLLCVVVAHTARRLMPNVTSFWPAAAVFAAIATGLVLTETGVSLGRRAGRVAVMGVVSAMMLVAAFVPLLWVDGHAWRQIFDHGADNLRTGGFLETWREAWRNGRYLIVASGGVVVTVMLLFVWAVRAGSGATWLRWFPAALIMIGLIILKTGGKFYYIWFAGPWLVTACVAMIGQAWVGHLNRRLIFVAAAILTAGCVYGAQFWVVERLVVASLPPEQRFDAAAVRIKAVVPAGATVMAFEHWVTLVGRNPIRDHNTPSPANKWEPIDYIVLTGNGSKVPGVAQPHLPVFIDYAAKHFEKIDDNLAIEPLRIGGVRITNSAYGWGAVVYKRVSK